MTSIILYSKYSTECKRLFSMIEESGFDMTFIKFVCIDNIDIRKRISSSQNIQITLVPTALITDTNGLTEKYDGTHIYQWLKQIIDIKQQELAPPPRVQQLPSPPQKRRQIQQYIEEDDEEEYNPPPPRVKKSKKQKPIQKPIQKPQTSIDELESDDDNYEEIDMDKQPLQQKPVMLATIDELDDEVESKVSESTKSGGDIMKAAQAMQKDRESSIPKDPTNNL